MLSNIKHICTKSKDIEMAECLIKKCTQVHIVYNMIVTNKIISAICAYERWCTNCHVIISIDNIVCEKVVEYWTLFGEIGTGKMCLLQLLNGSYPLQVSTLKIINE